jgi:hypothetical protein
MLCTAFLILAQLGDMVWPIYTIHETSLRQAITPGHLLFWGALPLGALAGGAIAQNIGMRQTMLAGTLGYLRSTAPCGSYRRRTDHRFLWSVKLAKTPS